ncbi:MAG: DUF971 domain-containing protein [Planctomycetes bacterium]|nr:DUF971 domain-containing protein [Planctomycetota bacterium]
MKPTAIKRLDPKHLQISWPDGVEVTLDASTLRGDCRCALCVDEMTGVRTYGPDQVPRDVGYKDVALVGNYAIQMNFSDGHSTGIFTFRHLRELADVRS